MKLRSILGCFIAASLVFATAPDMMAQKKSSSSRKTPSKSTSTSSAITKDKLVGKTYKGWLEMEKDVLIDVDVTLDENQVVFNFGNAKGTGTWDVNANTINATLKSGMKLKLSSPDKGFILQGTFTLQGTTGKVKLYENRDFSWDKTTLINALVKNDFYTLLLAVDNSGIGIDCPITFKFTKDPDNPNEGTFKISGDHKMLTELGVLKGSIVFDDNQLTIRGINGNETTEKYSDMEGTFYLRLGVPYVSGKKYYIGVNFIKK